MDIEDTFAFMENRRRRRVESDVSSLWLVLKYHHQMLEEWLLAGRNVALEESHRRIKKRMLWDMVL